MDNQLTQIQPIAQIEPTPMDIDLPQRELQFASEIAKRLKDIVDSKPRKVIINREQYLEFEDWQTIARFYNCTVGTDWTKEINRENKLVGFEARATVFYHGQIVSSAEASCLRDEPNWNTKPEFQLKSMAQTRASVKALRNVFAWVVVLAGYRATPAEEMDDKNGFEPTPPTNPKSNILICQNCQKNKIEIPISRAEAEYSRKLYGQELCRNCQAILKEIQNHNSPNHNLPRGQI